MGAVGITSDALRKWQLLGAIGMVDKYDAQLVLQARAVPYEDRVQLLSGVPTEAELRRELVFLFRRMDPQADVEETHGADEYGKDIVVLTHTPFGSTAWAAVVKNKAKISGASATDVKDIEDQVKMCFRHPAQLKSSLDPLKIDSVKVVLPGELSKNAQKRLLAEFDDRVEFWLMDWLVEQFTQYYPEFFLGGPASSYLLDAIQALELNHLFSMTGKLLSECFVEPHLRRREVSPTQPGFDKFKPKQVRLLSLFGQPHLGQCVLILGDAGSGKSAAMSMLTITRYRQAMRDFAAHGGSEPSLVPVLVTANDVADCDTASEVAELVDAEELPGRLTCDVLLVDALDEAPAERRTGILELLSDYASQSGVRVVVTSRRIDVLNEGVTGFDQFELEPLKLGQALTFVRRVVKNPKVVVSLESGLESLRDRMDLTPLAIRLLIQLAEENREIPASATELYDRYADLALGKFDYEKGLNVLFDYEVKKQFLGELAWSLFVRGSLDSVDRPSFDAFRRSFFESYGQPLEDANSFLSEIERAGILELGKSGVRFRHKSFTEFFAAYHLFARRDEQDDLPQLLTSLHFDPTWSEITFFYYGLAKSISMSAVDSIIDYPDDGPMTHLQKLFLGRVLQAAWISSLQVKVHGLSRALDQVPRMQADIDSLALSAEVQAVPPLVWDAILMSFCAQAFGSVTLKEAAQRVLGEMTAVDGTDALRALSLGSAMYRLLDQDERENFRGVMEAYVGKSGDRRLDFLATAMMLEMEPSDSAAHKSLKRHMEKLRTRHRGYLRQLMAPTRAAIDAPPPGDEETHESGTGATPDSESDGPSAQSV